jgi:hypothetical protein
MNIQSQHELKVSREKLSLLEERYEANMREQAGNEHVRELSMRSLERFSLGLHTDRISMDWGIALQGGGLCVPFQ